VKIQRAVYRRRYRVCLALRVHLQDQLANSGKAELLPNEIVSPILGRGPGERKRGE
jgi:hypothetical protein